MPVFPGGGGYHLEKYKDYFPGNTPVPMRKIVDAYVKCIEGKINGRIIRVMA